MDLRKELNAEATKYVNELNARAQAIAKFQEQIKKLETEMEQIKGGLGTVSVFIAKLDAAEAADKKAAEEAAAKADPATVAAGTPAAAALAKVTESFRLGKIIIAAAARAGAWDPANPPKRG